MQAELLISLKIFKGNGTCGFLANLQKRALTIGNCRRMGMFCKRGAARKICAILLLHFRYRMIIIIWVLAGDMFGKRFSGKKYSLALVQNQNHNVYAPEKGSGRRLKMLKEFKKFALRGNMMDLAVGVIIGGAFNSIVNSLVNDIIMPFLSLFTGKLDFSNWFIALDGKKYDTLAMAQTEGVATINFGTFLSGMLNFIIMAFVVFLIVKGMNKLKKEEAPAAPTTKKCPHCMSVIDLKATRCPHCTSELTEE